MRDRDETVLGDWCYSACPCARVHGDSGPFPSVLAAQESLVFIMQAL